MMLGVVGEHVAAGTERTPADARLVQFVYDRRRLFFSFRRDDPVDRAADAQTRQFGKPAPAFGAHAEPGGDLFERSVAVFKLIGLRIRKIHL